MRYANRSSSKATLKRLVIWEHGVHEHPVLSYPDEPLVCGPCNYCDERYTADSMREEQR